MISVEITMWTPDGFKPVETLETEVTKNENSQVITFEYTPAETGYYRFDLPNRGGRAERDMKAGATREIKIFNPTEEAQKAVTEFITKVAAVSSGQSTICLDCGQPFKRLEQVGRCVYARPCGHRQYQGKVPK